VKVKLVDQERESLPKMTVAHNRVLRVSELPNQIGDRPNRIFDSLLFYEAADCNQPVTPSGPISLSAKSNLVRSVPSFNTNILAGSHPAAINFLRIKPQEKVNASPLRNNSAQGPVPSFLT
jgi:hypothetical protein